MEEREDWFIAIEGNIGAGKTTLSKMLAEDWNTGLLLEQFEDNSFLPKFYQYPERYAFPLEMSFLAARFNQLKSHIPQGDLFRPSFVSDYVLFKSLVFARITLDDDEYSLHQRMFEIIDQQIRKPDLVVYLHRPVHRLVQNITKRGRSYELDITHEYLEKVHEGYMSYFRTIPQQAVLILELEGLDFESNPMQYAAIKALIT
ncbi:MAG: deoxynucleoside kinase, partial [Bacteroidota bacterium]|nr:deoxynucleoside kinase [Bacteroidota bacterium]MDX5430076.1 deoxynucleoside kinase [Bacteroidota bacterium]MDX5468840.1 deoxynucleoside kinase [Bacteroidota bacterium]